MKIQEQHKIKFLGVGFVDVQLNSFAPTTEDNLVNVDNQAKVFYPEGSPNVFKIIMETHVSIKEAFQIFVRAIGHFEASSGLTPETRSSFVNLNAPAIMYPYVRSYISNLTANSGGTVPPITIPPQVFDGELEEVE